MRLATNKMSGYRLFKAFPSGEGGSRRLTDEEIILRIVLLYNVLLIHRFFNSGGTL